jgi:hypothetical protein
MTAEEMKNIDVWRPQRVMLDNSKFRRNNHIYTRQIGIHVRNVDKNNDGLAHIDPLRASLVNPQRTCGDMGSLQQSTEIPIDMDPYTF